MWAPATLNYLFVGLARTIYIRCVYGIFGRESTEYTVHVYMVLANPACIPVNVWFWPSLDVYAIRKRSNCMYKNETWVLAHLLDSSSRFHRLGLWWRFVKSSLEIYTPQVSEVLCLPIHPSTHCRTCRHTPTHFSTHTRFSIHTQLTHTHTHLYTHTLVYTHITHTHTHIITHTQTHTHTLQYTHTRTPLHTHFSIHTHNTHTHT